MIKSASFVLTRLLDLALLLLGLATFFLDDLVWVAAWDLLAVVYLAVRVYRVRRGRTGRSPEWLRTTLGPRTGLLFTLFASIVGISAGLSIVMPLEETAEVQEINKFFAVPAVLLAWAILHFGYAERYAQAYYKALPQEILVFPETERPNFADFAYFAFTIGNTFAVSDVETRTSAVRTRVLAHGVLSFIYNTVTLGIAIGVITGK
ncbi:putative membrane protein [Crossiella equi]|uniref:Membrane protein n=1 Tax=Crossiella equi TaxID=130796 RepID=A0ABS5ADT9_9PSEU|nr:DUF1345 domain-containing protein [Crossiella equi]MBP2474750.1 putative membrane protein [Crossiella equi]